MSEKVSSKGIYHTELISKSAASEMPYTTHAIYDNGVWEKYGSLDTYPDYILSLYKNSNKHSSIIKTKKNLALGNGLKFTQTKYSYKKLDNGEYSRTENTISESELKTLIEKAESFFYRIGIGEEFKQKNEERFFNWFVFGGGYVTLQKKILTDQSGKNAVSKIIALKNEQFTCVRRGVAGKLSFNEPTKFNFLCQDFSSASTSGIVNFANYKEKKGFNPVVRIPVYDKSSTDWKYQSLFYGISDIGRSIYPTPDYESKGALASIESDYLLSLFDRAEINNGMSLDYIVLIKRMPLPDDIQEKEKQKKEKEYWSKNLKGSENSGSFILQWQEPDPENPDAKAVEIIEVPRNKDYNYIKEKRESVGREILSAHGIVVSELAGIQGYDSGGFSSQAEKIHAAAVLFHDQRIEPIQQADCSMVLNVLLADEGIPLTVSYIPRIDAIQTISDAILENFYLNDEVRQKFGDKPLTEDQKKQLIIEVAVRNSKTQTTNGGN